MQIIIDSDDFTLEDVKALGRLVRECFKGGARHGNMLVLAGRGDLPVEDAIEALTAIFEDGTSHFMLTDVPPRPTDAPPLLPDDKHGNGGDEKK